jgi:hypothetical protein
LDGFSSCVYLVWIPLQQKRPKETSMLEGDVWVIKRVSEDYVTATKFVNMAKGMAMKASIYNGFMTMA